METNAAAALALSVAGVVNSFSAKFKRIETNNITVFKRLSHHRLYWKGDMFYLSVFSFFFQITTN